MPAFSPAALLDVLAAHGAADPARYCVALSGGLDSSVLLHALHRATDVSAHLELRAVHIDHQLHPDSSQWGAHCAAACERLGVPFTTIAVHVRPQSEGLEAAARRVRYEALRRILRPEEVLLTAHHADDQLETVLLALARGAGVKGLSGIAAAQAFGPGRLVRPLLAFTRAELKTWAQHERIAWVEDPSNARVDLDRNFLRAEVAPGLTTRWPAAATNASRSAAHLAEAAQLLNELADADWRALRDGDALRIEGLQALSPSRRRNVLRHWFHLRGARMPSTRKLATLEHTMLSAPSDRAPSIAWDQVIARRYRGALHLEPRPAPLEADCVLDWDGEHPLRLPAELGSLWLRESAQGVALARLQRPLQIRFRVGGECIKPIGAAHHRDLKKLLQEAGIPPWRRGRIPLVYSGNQLVWVGDLWAAETFAAHDEPAVRLVWERSTA